MARDNMIYWDFSKRKKRKSKIKLNINKSG